MKRTFFVSVSFSFLLVHICFLVVDRDGNRRSSGSSRYYDWREYLNSINYVFGSYKFVNAVDAIQRMNQYEKNQILSSQESEEDNEDETSLLVQKLKETLNVRKESLQTFWNEWNDDEYNYSNSNSNSSSSSSSLKKVVWIGDIHFDPLYGTKEAYRLHEKDPICERQFGQYGCDSPWELVKQSFHEMKRIVKDPSYVLFLGDFMRHINGQNRNSMEDLKFITREIQVLFRKAYGKHTPVIFNVGNSDFALDYGINITSWGPMNENEPVMNPWFKDWSIVLHQGGWLEDPKSLATFQYGGYYSRIIPSERLMIISLDSIVYSSNLHERLFQEFGDNALDVLRQNNSDKVSVDNKHDDPFGQFEWLENELNHARRDNFAVQIVSHIPPAIDHYSRKPLWEKRYQDRFMKLIHSYNDVVRFLVHGHEHIDIWRINKHYLQQNFPPMFVTSSISPVFGNNPSFRSVQLDKSYFLLDYKVYWTPLKGTLPTYKLEYDSFEAYKSHGLKQPITSSGIAEVIDRLYDNETLWNEYYPRVFQQSEKLKGNCQFTSQCHTEHLCLLQYPNIEDYDQCLHRNRIPVLNPLPVSK